MAARSQAWVCGRFPGGIVSSNPACLSLVIVVYFQVEVSASGRSLIQRSPTECVVSECVIETSR